MTASQLNKFKNIEMNITEKRKKPTGANETRGKGGGYNTRITEKNPPAFFKPKIRSLCLKFVKYDYVGYICSARCNINTLMWIINFILTLDYVQYIHPILPKS